MTAPFLIVVIDDHTFLIDEADWERLKHHDWRFTTNTAGRPIVQRYVGPGAGDQVNIYHDVLQEEPAGRWVDHINGDPADHRRANLRFCAPQQNNWNRRAQPNAAVPYKGDTRSPNGKRFCASIGPRGARKRIGTFDTATEAALAFDAAARVRYGEFAWLNADHFPELAETGWRPILVGDLRSSPDTTSAAA